MSNPNPVNTYYAIPTEATNGHTADRTERAAKTNRARAVASGRIGGTKADRQRIREWASLNGYDQSPVGQLKTEVVVAYYEAHPDAVHLDGKTDWPTKPPRSARRKKTRAKAKKAPATPAPRKPKVIDEIEVTRDYRHPLTGLRVSLHLDGTAEVSVPKQPKIKMTVAQLRALASIAARAEEMNRVMGI